MKKIISITGLIIAIAVLLLYLTRERPSLKQRVGQKIVDIITMKESFGVSPGTLTQLAANHVPTAEDIPMLQQWMKERQQGIWQMTESDLVGKAPMDYSVLGNRIGAFA